MDEDTARRILRDFIRPNGSLYDDGNCWVQWPERGSEAQINIDGRLDADQLEAMAWWIRNKTPPKSV